MRIETDDHYTVLQVQPGATPDEVHRAYRTLAMKYHPDRNTAPEAAAAMARINEAYAVLSDPIRRRKYDRQQRISCSNDLALPIVAAARDAILKQRWTVLHDEGSNLLLEKQSRRVRITFMDRLTNAKLRMLGRHYTEFGVVLAVEVEKPINLSLQIAIIDLVHSLQYGAPFPDDVYRELFERFLCGSGL